MPLAHVLEDDAELSETALRRRGAQGQQLAPYDLIFTGVLVLPAGVNSFGPMVEAYRAAMRSNPPSFTLFDLGRGFMFAGTGSYS